MASRKPSGPKKEQADLANVVMQMEMELMVLVITLVCWVIQFAADPDAPHGVVGDIVDASTAGGLGADPLESPPAEVKTCLGEPVGDEDVTAPLSVGGDQSSSKSASDEIDELLVMRASAEAFGREAFGALFG